METGKKIYVCVYVQGHQLRRTCSATLGSLFEGPSGDPVRRVDSASGEGPGGELPGTTNGLLDVPSPVKPNAPGMREVGSFPEPDALFPAGVSFCAFSSDLVIPFRQCGQVSCSFNQAETHG